MRISQAKRLLYDAPLESVYKRKPPKEQARPLITKERLAKLSGARTEISLTTNQGNLCSFVFEAFRTKE